MLKGQKKHIDKEQGKTKHEAPRSVNYRASQNKNNIGTTASERSVVNTTGGFKGLSLYKQTVIKGGSRNFERGVHKILGSRITVFRLWPLFESLVGASLWKFVLHSGVQPCIRLYVDTHRMKQYLLFWLKTKCLKCYTMYNILLSNKLLSSTHVTWVNFSTENIKWHIFLDFCCYCNANLYSRMAEKLSKGSN